MDEKSYLPLIGVALGWLRVVLVWLLAVGSVLVGGCAGTAGLAFQQEFQTLAQGTVSPVGAGPATVRILRNQGEFEAFWDELHAAQSPPPPVPPVSFPDKMVIALVDIARPTGGYSVEITAVQPTDQGIFITAAQKSPGPGCVVTQALTRPYHIVVTSWVPGNPSLTLVPVVQDCGSQ